MTTKKECATFIGNKVKCSFEGCENISSNRVSDFIMFVENEKQNMGDIIECDICQEHFEKFYEKIKEFGCFDIRWLSD